MNFSLNVKQMKCFCLSIVSQIINNSKTNGKQINRSESTSNQIKIIIDLSEDKNIVYLSSKLWPVFNEFVEGFWQMVESNVANFMTISYN